MTSATATRELVEALDDIRLNTTGWVTGTYVRSISGIDWAEFVDADWVDAAHQFIAGRTELEQGAMLTIWFSAAAISDQPRTTIAAMFGRQDSDQLYQLIAAIADTAWHTRTWTAAHATILELACKQMQNSDDSDDFDDLIGTVNAELCGGVWDGQIAVTGNGIATRGARIGAGRDLLELVDTYPDLGVDIAVRQPDTTVELLKHLLGTGTFMSGGPGRRLREAVRQHQLGSEARSLAVLCTHDGPSMSALLRNAGDDELAHIVQLTPTPARLVGAALTLPATVYAIASRRGPHVTGHLRVPVIRQLVDQLRTNPYLMTRPERQALTALTPAGGPRAQLWDTWTGTLGELDTAVSLVDAGQEPAAA